MGNVYQISSQKPFEVVVQLAFYINIHTQVKNVRRELKWLSIFCFYHHSALSKVIKNLILFSIR